MKILAGIPTRLRSTSGKIADVLAEVADEVLVISQGATCNHISGKVRVVEYPVDYGLVPARNQILAYAIDHGFDVVIQSDDDLAYRSDVVESIIRQVVDNPTLGACASESRAYYKWNKEVECSKEFLLASCAPQLWAARTSVLEEVGPWSLPFLEDRDHGCRMWKAGYAIGQLHVSLAMTHNPFVARTSAGKQGGQTEVIGGEMHSGLKKAIQFMKETYPDMLTINYLEGGNRTFSTRYKWERMISMVHERFGVCMGYQDSRGRSV